MLLKLRLQTRFHHGININTGNNLISSISTAPIIKFPPGTVIFLFIKPQIVSVSKLGYEDNYLIEEKNNEYSS